MLISSLPTALDGKFVDCFMCISSSMGCLQVGKDMEMEFLQHCKA